MFGFSNYHLKVIWKIIKKNSKTHLYKQHYIVFYSFTSSLFFLSAFVQISLIAIQMHLVSAEFLLWGIFALSNKLHKALFKKNYVVSKNISHMEQIFRSSALSLTWNKSFIFPLYDVHSAALTLTWNKFFILQLYDVFHFFYIPCMWSLKKNMPFC